MTDHALAAAVAALAADLEAQAAASPGEFQFVRAEDPTAAYLEFDSVDLTRAVRAALAAATLAARPSAGETMPCLAAAIGGRA